MKKFGLSVSIKNNTNLVVSSTDCNWNKLPIGGYFEFPTLTKHFEVINKTPLFYIKDFQVLNRQTIQINENVFPYIFQNDSLQITYKEFEYDFHFMGSPGAGYEAGELVFAEGGKLAPDVGESLSFEIVKVGAGGQVEELKCISAGKYIQPPAEIVSFSSNKRGQGLSLSVKFKEISNRSFTEKRALNISYEQNLTTITLPNALPEGVTNGKVSVRKWTAEISPVYFDVVHKDCVKKPYKVFSDYTSHLKLVYLVPNSANQETIINNNFKRIDEELKALRELLSE